MDYIEKTVSLFKYIKELYAQKYKIVTDVKKQEWVKFINEIPQDEENIEFNYLDKTDEITCDEEDTAVILKVRKPDFEKCPTPPDSLENWIEGDWTRYTVPTRQKNKLTYYKDDNEVTILFTDDINRVNEFNQWKSNRDTWINRQVKIQKTRAFFNELYYLYIDLERDSETIEFMVGQGILDCKTSDSSHVNHPLLLKRLAIKFDSENNILTVIDTNTNPQIYTMLLQEIDYINHSAIKNIKEQLAENFYHPLDRNETPDFLKAFAHMLHSDSKYEDNPNVIADTEDKIIIYNNPVLFVRKRIGGVLKALEDIIEQISETGEISGPILNLIGENVSQLAEPIESLDFSQSIAAISGEDKDILLSKEANKEQLEIAKKIENYNAVLVQGPPGTGKTHTIANLMGHFLAQGKNILITSHTKKALSVVKEKVVPELQNLCVAVLDDNNKDMERSIDGITEYISSHTSLELEENTIALKEKRDNLLAEVSDIRKKLYAIKYMEYETISFGGKGYSVAEAARFVFDNQDELSYLPGKVKLNTPLPVPISDLELLYQTNTQISTKEETELSCNLPNPKELFTPIEFDGLLKEKKELSDNLKTLKDCLADDIIIDINCKTAEINGKPLCIKYNSEKAHELIELLKTDQKKELSKWQMNAMLAGKKGGGYKVVWSNLIGSIDDAYQYASQVIPLLIGKNIEIDTQYISEKSIGVLNEIKEYYGLGKKINALTLLMHKEWKSIISNSKINEKEIVNAEDCEALVSFIILNIKRNTIKNQWIELIEKNEGVEFKEFGDEPEQACISFINQIKDCICWYEDSFKPFKSMALECGFCSECINRINQYTNPIQEIEYFSTLIYKMIPQYIELAEIIYIKFPMLEKRIEEVCNKLRQNNGVEKSVICTNLECTIKNEDSKDYKMCYEMLNDLYEKNYYQSERKRILEVISKFAPEWAMLIQNRIGIHGADTVPENIEGAWKWKQFAGIIDEITAQPFEEMQHKLINLNLELRKVTAKLAENMAWYHLLERIEADISKKQALQGWKLTTKKIGKGTGKTAPKLKKEAQKLMAQCQSAVPAWIMPVNKALETINPKENKFDIIIIDEASQSDISALAIMYLAKKIIIVGDDEQVSPSAVGVDVDKAAYLSDMYIKGVIPNAHLYDMKSSLYDIAKTTFPTLMLKEHFRCVPSIIGYSNRLSYDYKIKPLRDDSNVPIKPATISYHVNGERSSNKINKVEAHTIVALMLSCMQQPEYKGMTFGAISLLGSEQAKEINTIAIEKISPQKYEKCKVLCGDASNFQGDERDVIFISLVDSNEGEGPLRMTGEGVGKSTKQRYNVAASRAKNQLWVVHSLDLNNDLKPGDLRKDLIEYAMNPSNFEQQELQIISKSDSPFEVSVANALVKNGYNIVQQWPVGAYRIDMVALYEDKKIAIECDGELYHSGDEKIRADMERQAILERLGWRFIRIRGSEYYRNPNETIKRVITELEEYNIFPEMKIEIKVDESELKQRVIAVATQILNTWESED